MEETISVAELIATEPCAFPGCSLVRAEHEYGPTLATDGIAYPFGHNFTSRGAVEERLERIAVSRFAATIHGPEDRTSLEVDRMLSEEVLSRGAGEGK